MQEIAEYLGIKRDTLYKWIYHKKMPAHKVGKLWKFRKEDVDEWARSAHSGNERTIRNHNPDLASHTLVLTVKGQLETFD